MMPVESADYKAAVRRAVLDEKTFLRLTLSGKLHEDDTPWIKVSVRPVVVQGERRLQFSWFDPKKDISRNFAGGEAAARLDEVLSIPFGRLHVQSTHGDLHVRITRRGKVLMTHGKASRQAREVPLAHDRVKRRLLSADDAFLRAIGIADANGRVLPSMQGKFTQVDGFLRIIEQVVDENDLARGPVTVVDCGCGSASLTFAAWHYLNDIRGIPASACGVDTSDELIRKCSDLRDSLGWKTLEFRASSIADFVPASPPDIVLSLHACDTATDGAIARGVLWQSRVILAAPCCQHELHRKIRAPLFQPMLRHGVLRERLADLLTDTFRALVLRIMGYRTRVIEFVSPEHTSKNLMIRAERHLKPGDPAAVSEYQALKTWWSVEPVIEGMLGDAIRPYLTP